MLKLYHQGSSVCAAKVRIVLHEKDLDWESEYVDVLQGEQFDPAYLKLNPNAVVPTLVHDEKVVIESTVNCEYLDDVFPEPPLRPTDPYQLAQMRIWTKRVDERLHPMTSVLTYSASHRHTILDNNTPEQVQAIINETRDPVKRARKKEWIQMGMDAPTAREAVKEFTRTMVDMDKVLAAHPWIAGNTYSLADVAYGELLGRAVAIAPLGQDGQLGVFDANSMEPITLIEFEEGLNAPAILQPGAIDLTDANFGGSPFSGGLLAVYDREDGRLKLIGRDVITRIVVAPE